MTGETNRIHLNNLSPGDIALLKDIAEAAADKSVFKMLQALGMSPDDPIASQELFASLRKLAESADDPEWSKDREWTRWSRTMTQGAMGKAIVTAVGIAVVGAMHAIWTGIKAMIPGTPPH